MYITYFGHSCFQVEIADTKILFDPFIRPNSKAQQIDPLKIEADYLLVSHGHFDHIADAEEIAKNTNALLITNWEIHQWFVKKGLQHVQPMNSGGSFKTPFGKIHMTPAVHSSSLPDGSYGGNPNGFAIQSSEGGFYYSGDTDLFSDMQLIARRFQPSFAFLPIGDVFTMNIEAACEAAILLRVRQVIGMHYDTFPTIEIDHTEAKEKFAQQGIELILMQIGERRKM